MRKTEGCPAIHDTKQMEKQLAETNKEVVEMKKELDEMRQELALLRVEQVANQQHMSSLVAQLQSAKPAPSGVELAELIPLIEAMKPAPSMALPLAPVAGSIPLEDLERVMGMDESCSWPTLPWVARPRSPPFWGPTTTQCSTRRPTHQTRACSSH